MHAQTHLAGTTPAAAAAEGRRRAGAPGAPPSPRFRHFATVPSEPMVLTRYKRAERAKRSKSPFLKSVVAENERLTKKYVAHRVHREPGSGFRANWVMPKAHRNGLAGPPPAAASVQVAAANAAAARRRNGKAKRPAKKVNAQAKEDGVREAAATDPRSPTRPTGPRTANQSARPRSSAGGVPSPVDAGALVVERRKEAQRAYRANLHEAGKLMAEDMFTLQQVQIHNNVM